MNEQHPGNNFDGIRLLLALLVIWGHQEHSKQWAADAAVLSFFALSGLLVSRSWFADPDPWRFFQRRFLRIWPGLALVVIVCAAAAYWLASGPWIQMERLASTFYLRNLWLHTFDWSFFARGRMNGPLWTLPYEVDLYAAVAVLGLFGTRVFFVVAPSLWIAAFFAAPINGLPSQLGEAWSLYFAGFFFAGACLGQWPGLLRPHLTLVAMATGIGLLAAGKVDVGRLVLIPFATVAIGRRSWPVLRSLSRYGDLSYGAYIWAWPIQQVTHLWLPDSVPIWLQLVVVVPQVLLVAFVSWHAVEKRALRMKPRAAPASNRERARWRWEIGSLRETGERLRGWFGRLRARAWPHDAPPPGV